MIRAVVIAGVTSGVGKTTIATAVMHGLRKKGLQVQPFKVGPDFIDPSYHNLVTGRQSRNLDLWMMKKQGVIECFDRSCDGADVAVIEGVMGLYDGISGKDNFASTADVARILDAPVILVIDAAKSARSVAAIALGFIQFDRKIKIVGIILNNVAGDRHAGYIKEAFVGKIKAPIVGIIRRNKEIKMEERHLGLVPAYELQQAKQKALMQSAKIVSEQIDLDSVLGLCSQKEIKNPLLQKSKVRARIAVALDESFNFYYADNLDALRNAGARLVFFSPVNDRQLPEADGLMLGGGFPEVLADRLEKNREMIKSVLKAVNSGLPVYGECGGLMYLTKSITGYRGDKSRKMVGVVDAKTEMTARLTLNYTEADCNCQLFGQAVLRGHEFHYSQITDIASDSRFAYVLRKGKGVAEGKDGFLVQNSLAAYTHLHFANGRLAERLVNLCEKQSRR